jgi:hypothetical protein
LAEASHHAPGRALSPRRNATDFPAEIIIPAQSTQQRHANTSCLIPAVSAQTQLPESEKKTKKNTDPSFFLKRFRAEQTKRAEQQLHEASFLLSTRGANTKFSYL